MLAEDQRNNRGGVRISWPAFASPDGVGTSSSCLSISEIAIASLAVEPGQPQGVAQGIMASCNPKKELPKICTHTTGNWASEFSARCRLGRERL